MDPRHLPHQGQKQHDGRFFVKSTHHQKNYVAKSADPDLEAAIHKINVDELEMVSLQTLSPKALADAQALCSPMPCHKNGNKPKSIKMGYHTINTSNCFVKFHKTNGP